MNNEASFARKKVLVSGAAGFLGSALCKRLLADGYEVAGLDSYFAGSRQRIEHLLRHGCFTMYYSDMASPGLIDQRFDQIFDLSGSAGQTRLHCDPIDKAEGGHEGGIGLLALAKRRGGKFLHASSSRRHDDNAHAFFSDQMEENDDHENLLVKEVRIFNAYGPKMSIVDDRAVSRFIMNALKGETLIINGDGCQIRSFCFVDDIVDGLIGMMALSEDVVGPIDLGSSESCMILDLVNMIIEATGTSSRIAFEPQAATGPASCLPNLPRTKAHLSWSARMPIRIGLAETIDYVDQLLCEGRNEQPLKRPMPISLQSSVA